MTDDSKLCRHTLQNHCNDDQSAAEYLHHATHVERNIIVIGLVKYETCTTQKKR